MRLGRTKSRGGSQLREATDRIEDMHEEIDVKEKEKVLLECELTQLKKEFADGQDQFKDQLEQKLADIKAI